MILHIFGSTKRDKEKNMITPIEKTIDLGDGRSITIETGKLAKQADGAVVVKMGNTYLLATVVRNNFV